VCSTAELVLTPHFSEVNARIGRGENRLNGFACYDGLLTALKRGVNGKYLLEIEIIRESRRKCLVIRRSN
jgi:hypothetical protein